MESRSRDDAEPFITLDGSEIRVLLDGASGARNQSLAEATLPAGASTKRHRHPRTEELYVLLEGAGEMEVDGETRPVASGDAILIPPGARHRITAGTGGPLRFLCCCAPPYSDDDTVFD
ncbi:MAG: cupin domain-containing protein [Thermoleophilia bacterium]|nr:cupin domain-containing protein [Thermoleophilia bacterium]